MTERFTKGQRLTGFVWTDQGKEVQVFGAYEAITNDPEENTQDVIIRDDNGKVHYINEYEVRVA